MLRAFHFGHAGRDAMLREASGVWWPRIHREIVEKARNCNECRLTGKNLKCMKTQNEFGKLPAANQPNEEISLDFAGPFHNANIKKKYLLVSVDNYSAWPDALLLPNPTTDKVIEILLEYIAKNGIPKRIRTDPGTAFKSEKFKAFCKEKFIDHVVCPVRDHKGNGKVEKMIRTINERLRTNTKILISKDKSGISNILFALRSEKGPDKKSAFERQNGRKPNTEKSRMIEKCILDQDPQIEIEPEDFSEEADSTILVRERVRGTKLEGAFKKVKGQIVGESTHTITILPKTGKQIVYSKRDVAASDKKASGSKTASNSKMTNNNEQGGSKTTNKRKTSEEKEERANKEQKKEIEAKSKTAMASKMGLIPQSELTTNDEIDVHIKQEENPAEETIEQPETTSNDKEEEEQLQSDTTDETTNWPIKGSIKWEKSRSSARVTKKPDRWGNNIMISKIEPESAVEEESLPSVIEIPNPKNT